MIGDLDDLRGAPPVTEYADPDHPDEAVVAGAAVDALKARCCSTTPSSSVSSTSADAELRDTQRALEKAYLRPTYRWREKVVRRLESGGTGRLR